MAKVSDDQISKKFVFTTENVESITKQMSDGFIPKNYQVPWFGKQVGIRKDGISFEFTKEEIDEYIKCSQDIHYFAEKYCKIKREDGSIGNIKLREYQKDILDLYYDNSRVILCASRQIGKCFGFNTLVNINGKNERIGVIYYSLVSSFRKLNILEKIKIKLYNSIFLLEGKHKN